MKRKRLPPPKADPSLSARSPESKSYFRALGQHITYLRKARGLSQAELARAIGVSQQAVFAYELGERRTSILILERMAKVFGIPVQEITGFARPAREPKRRLSLRAERHARRLMNLSKTQQRFVVRIIDVLELGNARWSANQHSRKAA